MKIVTNCISTNTKKAPEFIDITEYVCRFVEESKVQNGMALVYSKHTTAAIKINENEPLLIEDMEKFLDGHAHCQHLLMGTSETVPIVDGQVQVGTWQRIFLVELDMPRPREVIVQILGE